MAIKTEELSHYVKLAAEGDKASFEEIYRQTYSAVYFTCLSFLKNEQDAADMTQEVYVTVLDSLSALEDHGKFMPWINRITVNKCKNRLKAVKAFPMDMEDENQPVEENENFLPEEYITNQAKRRIVMDIMKDRLTEAQYQTVVMFYFNEFTAQEISEIMECPIGTVTYRLSAAREKIRQGVSEYENTSHDKLYTYASAVPLLAGLLTAEALSLGNVQAASAGAASITNAASAIDAAKISKGGTIIRMLKAPKIMIATTAAVVTVGGIAAAVIATSSGSVSPSDTQTEQESLQASSDTAAVWENPPLSSNTATVQENPPVSSDTAAVQENPPVSSDTAAAQENPPVSSDTAAVQENPPVSSDTDELTFWLHTVDWGEEKDLTGITLFHGECTTPINLKDLDGDRRLTPYCNIENKDLYSDNLTELFDSDQQFEGELLFMPQCNHEADTTIDLIKLCNYSDEEVTLKQAYENNWFYITAYDNFIDEFKTDDTSSFISTGTLDALIGKYGRPSYLIANEEADDEAEPFIETFHNNDGLIEYDLVWEKQDFVLILCLEESIQREEKSHTIDIHSYLSYSFAYVPIAFWPDFLEKQYNDYGEFYTIYSLDELN